MRDLEEIEHFRSKLIINATPSEIYLKEKLDEWEINYKFQYPFGKDKFLCYVDFYFPKLKIYIELDGKHHYTDVIQINRDKRRLKVLRDDFGLKEIRIKNKNVFKISKAKFIILLEDKPKKKKKIKVKKEKWKKKLKPEMTLAQKLAVKKNIIKRNNAGVGFVIS